MNSESLSLIVKKCDPFYFYSVLKLLSVFVYAVPSTGYSTSLALNIPDLVMFPLGPRVKV